MLDANDGLFVTRSHLLFNGKKVLCAERLIYMKFI